MKVAKKIAKLRDYDTTQNCYKMFKIIPKLEQFFDKKTEKLNKARKNFIKAFVLGLINKGTVEFTELAKVLNDEVQESSNLRRIQMFFSDYELNYLAFARLFMDFVPLRRWDLSIDRTNWQFGQTNINILTLSIGYQGVGIPILFELLDKKGNSIQLERMNLMDKFVSLFGTQRIRSFTADREFIGKEWIGYLIDKKIPFYIRIKKNTRVKRTELESSAVELFELHPTKKELTFNGVEIMGNNLNIALQKDSSAKSEKEADHLILITNQSPRDAFNFYRKRWSIEVFFQCIKGRGFNMEKTHLTDLSRLKKLMALVGLAFCLCLTIGVYINECVKSIRKTSDGYKINSFFRVGKDKLERATRLIYKDFDMLEKYFKIIFDKISKNRLVLNSD
jgi:hypothetical protein